MIARTNSPSSINGNAAQRTIIASPPTVPTTITTTSPTTVNAFLILEAYTEGQWF